MPVEPPKVEEELLDDVVDFSSKPTVSTPKSEDVAEVRLQQQEESAPAEEGGDDLLFDVV